MGAKLSSPENEELTAAIGALRGELARVDGYRFSVLPSKLDETMLEFCRRVHEASSLERGKVLGLIDESFAYGLLAFSERMSMLAVRQASVEVLTLGLVALVLAAETIDPRMALMVLSLFHRSALKLEQEPRGLFEAAARSAVRPEAASVVLGFLERKPRDKDITAMGFREIDGPSGLVYWQGGSRPVPPGLL